jgi:hypothetical protein
MAFTKKPDPPKPPSPTPRPVTPKPQPQETDLFGPILAWWRRYPRWQRRAFLGIAVVVVLMLIGATQSSPPSQRQAKPACEQRTYTIDPGGHRYRPSFAPEGLSLRRSAAEASQSSRRAE